MQNRDSFQRSQTASTLIAVSRVSWMCCRVFLESAGFRHFILSAQVRKTKGNSADFCQQRCCDHSIKVTPLIPVKAGIKEGKFPQRTKTSLYFPQGKNTRKSL